MGGHPPPLPTPSPGNRSLQYKCKFTVVPSLRLAAPAYVTGGDMSRHWLRGDKAFLGYPHLWPCPLPSAPQRPQGVPALPLCCPVRPAMGLQRSTCRNQGEPQFSNSDDVPPPCPPGLAGTKPGSRLEKEQTMWELISTTILHRAEGPTHPKNSFV